MTGTRADGVKVYDVDIDEEDEDEFVDDESFDDVDEVPSYTIAVSPRSQPVDCPVIKM